jgi:hypothetical protein
MSQGDLFHQRNAMPAEDVAKGKRSATKQAIVILALFREHPASKLTPFEVHDRTGLDCPITSIRRAMTNLTKDGWLTKNVDQQRMGKYGMRNCTWSLRQ